MRDVIYEQPLVSSLQIKVKLAGPNRDQTAPGAHIMKLRQTRSMSPQRELVFLWGGGVSFIINGNLIHNWITP